MVLTTWPAELVTVMVRFEAAVLSCTPNAVVAPPERLSVLPGASTFEPTSIAAWVCWPA